MSDIATTMASRLLSLSREIRELVYDHVLQSETVSVPGAQSYKRVYYLNVMRVNRQLYHETKEHLYRYNIFVLVNYIWAGFGYAPHQLKIPVIAQRGFGISLPKHVFMQLDVENYGQPWVTQPSQICGLAEPNGNGLGSFLVLLSDLHGLISMIWWRFDSQQMARIYVDADGTRPFTIGTQCPHQNPFVQMKLFSNPHRANDFEWIQRNAIFQDWIRSFAGMVVTHRCNSVWLASTMPFGTATVLMTLRERMSKNINMAWALKSFADQLCKEGSITEARRACSLVVEHGILGSIDFDKSAERLRQRDIWPFAEQLGVLVCDAALMGVYLALRQLDVVDARRLVYRRILLSDALFPGFGLHHHLGHFPQTGKWNCDLLAFRHMIVLINLSWGGPGAILSAHGKTHRWFPGSLVHSKDEPKDREFWWHDHDLLQRLLERLVLSPNQPRQEGVSLIESSSAFEMPLRTFERQEPDPPLWQPPQPATMLFLPREKKDRIREVQEESGLPVVNFAWPWYY